MKNWSLHTIEDMTAAHCGYCGAALRWHYVLRQGGQEVRVGSECVKSFIDNADPAVAFRFFRTQWRQRRTYYWKRFLGLVWIIGPKKSGGWYVALTQSLFRFPWLFLGPHFETDGEAADYVAAHLLTPSWFGTKLRETVEFQEEN